MFIKLSLRLFVSDEDHIGRPNIYWRCVRSNSVSDVGSAHKDKWFWDLAGEKFQRIEKNQGMDSLKQGNDNAGLKILPGSHLKRISI